MVNYPEAYLRRRDPDCMLIGDDLPSDKERFQERYGTDFAALRRETLDWLGTQDLAAFALPAGLAFDPQVVTVFMDILGQKPRG